MKIIVTGERVAEYVSAKCEQPIYPPFTALGIEHDGKLIAGVVFNSFTGNDIEVTVAGDHGAFTRTFIRRVGDYIFKENKCLRLSVTTAQDSVIDYATRLGGQIEGLKRNHFGIGRDGVVIGILREEWKFR